MRRSSVKEYTDTMKRRYTSASKTEKGALLDEYVKVTQTRVADSTAGDDPVLIAGHEMWSGPLLDLGGLGNSSR